MVILKNVQGYVVGTHIEEVNNGIERGFVSINGEPQYQIEIDTETNLSRVCGYDQGCFWSNWQ